MTQEIRESVKYQSTGRRVDVFLSWIVLLLMSFCATGHADYLVDATCNPAYTSIVGAAGTHALNQTDDDADNVNLPFSAPFYEGRYTVARVQSNGAVYFSPTSGTIPYTNQNIPYASVNAAAYPFWDDFNPQASGDVYWTVRGTAPNREFVVEWYRVPHYSNTGRATVQFILNEGTGDITFLYPDVNFGNANYNNGRSATIGLQRDTSHAQGYSYNTASVSSGSAICYTYPKDFGDAPAGYGSPSHGEHGITNLFLGAGGDNPDIESTPQHSSDGLGDNNTGANDENGVTFRSPAKTGQSIFADVEVNNAAGNPVTVCGWLDVPAGGAVDGSFDTSDGHCQTTNAVNPTLTFQWSGLPADQQYTTYARFRVTTDTLSTSDPDTFVVNGEVEDYRLIFDFRPTLALIGSFHIDLVSPRNMANSKEYPGTAAMVSDLSQEGKKNEIAVVRWDTVQEHGTVGFYVERQAEGGEWQELNNDLMLPGLLDSPLGGEYALVDPDVSRGEVFSYRLIEEDIWNKRHTYGPWTVTIGAGEQTAQTGFGWKNVQGRKQRAVHKRDTGFFTKWRSLSPGFAGRARNVPRFKQKNVGAFLTSLPAGKSMSVSPGRRVNRVRLKTRDTAMYKCTVADLASATGQSVARITNKLKMNRWSFSTDDGGAAYYFDQTDQAVYFAADKHQTTETLDNVYRLGKFRHKKGWKMAEITGAGPEPREPGAFRDTLFFAEKNFFLTWLHNDENADYGYWASVYSGNAGPTVLHVEIPDPAASSTSDGRLRVVLRGASNKAEGNDHRARVRLNGTLLDGNAEWDGLNQAVLEVPFSQSLLGGTETGETVSATVEISSEALNGAAYSLFYIESVEISYARKMYAHEDALRLHVAESGPVTVSGFSNGNIKVIEAPNTRQAAWRKDLTIQQSQNGYQVSFTATAGEYQLSASPQSLVPETDYPSHLLSRRNRAEYLIIAPRSLQGSAEALLGYRSAQYQTKIIWLQDIYDVFSGGRVDSAAIEDFLRYVHARWQQVPEYVVLFGRGTLDHPDRLGFGESLIPLRMAATPWGLVGSDNRYADVNGDYVPDFSLGRIAVSTDDAGLAYVEKLKSYDKKPAAEWSTQAVVVADDPDPAAGDFPANSDAIATMLQEEGMHVNKLYHPGDPVRDTLLANWSAGLYGLVNYDGHGGRTQLGSSSENFLKVSDVAELNNGDSLPVFAALTCAAGDSSLPGTLSLGDTLTLQEGGGAIASFVPAGLSLDAPAHQLNRAFIKALTGKKETVGMAARSALEESGTTGMVPFMFDIYRVSGDPAVRMK